MNTTTLPPSRPRIRLDITRDAGGALRVTVPDSISVNSRLASPARTSRIDSVSPFPEARSRNKPLEVWNSSVCVRIYKTKWHSKKRRKTYRRYELVWTDAGQQHKLRRSNLDSAKALASRIAGDISSGQTARKQITEPEAAEYLRCKDLRRLSGKTLEQTCWEASENERKLNGVPIATAIDYYNAMHPAGQTSKTIPDIVTEFFEKRRMGTKWRRVLKKMLDRFAITFTGPPNTLQARAVDDWLDALKDRQRKPLGLRSRANYLDAIQSLLTFAKRRGYLLKDWAAIDQVSDPEPPAVAVEIYTPEELTALLNTAEKTSAGRKLVPFITTTAFAGVRHGEMNEDKIRLLDWSDYDLEEKTIYIGKAAAKTGTDRVVDMPDNLIAWLQPYIRPSGKICSLANTSNALCRLRAKAARELLDEAERCGRTERAGQLRDIARGLQRPKKNALRKSFISYKNALTRNIDLVADQAGNSPAVIRSNYKRTDTKMKRTAERWFNLLPDRADVLPLFNWRATA